MKEMENGSADMSEEVSNKLRDLFVERVKYDAAIITATLSGFKRKEQVSPNK